MEPRQSPMPRGRRIAIQLGAFAVCVLSGAVASTQMVAARFGHAPELGPPLFSVAETPVYPPWQWLVWYNQFGSDLRAPFADTQLPLVVGLLGGVALMVGLKKLLKAEDVPTAHGSSRWSTEREIEEAGLPVSPTDREGLVLGRLDDGSLLTHDGPEHAFCFAPTRSGKGVGLVIPTLLTWRESVVVLDVKRENWETTAGWRSLFSHTICFDPTSRDSVRFNPLFEVRKGDREVRDVRNIVEILCNPDGDRRDADDFWTESAKSLLTACILHVLYAKDDKSLAGVLAFLQNPERSLEETLEHMMETQHKNGEVHPQVARTARSLLDAPAKTRGGIVKTAERYLSLFDDPVLADVTRESDFRLDDLQRADSPVSLYLAVPPSDIQRLQPLLRLILVQLGTALTETLDPENREHRLLLLLDEFPTLGSMDWFESALAYFAGYDIRCFLIAQDLNQIEKAYGRNNAILGNCHLRVCFAPNDERTARRISDLLGEATAKKESTSLSGDRTELFMERHSRSESRYQRDLMTPGEVMQLPEDEEILLVAGSYPIRARKVRFYENEHFQRLCPEWNGRFTPPAFASDTPPNTDTIDWRGLNLPTSSSENASPAPPTDEPGEPGEVSDETPTDDAATSEKPVTPADTSESDTSESTDDAEKEPQRDETETGENPDQLFL